MAQVAPETLYFGPRNLAKLWNVKDIYITENGCSATDADGIVYDTDRIMFLRNYLTQLQRATAEGVPVRGYFHWSLLDNFEWADSYGTEAFAAFWTDLGRFQAIRGERGRTEHLPTLSKAWPQTSPLRKGKICAPPAVCRRFS